MKRVLIVMVRGILIATLIVFSTSSIFAANKDDLVNRFAELLKFNATNLENQKLTYETKVTSLFIRSSKENSIDLTMLIAYNEIITKTARTLTKNKVTPLIFSVSSMPFIETYFDPASVCFEQDGVRWFPKADESAFDMFPLGEDTDFGGIISDSELQQGVVLLPGIFDISKPIKISYKNFKKLVFLGR